MGGWEILAWWALDQPSRLSLGISLLTCVSLIGTGEPSYSIMSQLDVDDLASDSQGQSI